MSSNMFTVEGFSRMRSPTQTALSAGNQTLDCSKQHIFYLTGGTATINLVNLVEGQTVTLLVSTTGSSYTITWSPTIKWPNATVPQPTATASRYDIYSLIMVGGLLFGTAALALG